MPSRSKALLFATASLAILGAGGYLAFRLLTFLVVAFNPVALGFVLLLLFAEFFFIFQTIGYNANLLRSLRYAQQPRGEGAIGDHPAVAIFVVAYNEPASVLDATLRAVDGVRYPKKAVYLLDDRPTG